MKLSQSISHTPHARPLRLLYNWVLIGLGVLLAQWMLPGISYQGAGYLGENGWGTLVLVVVTISLLNLLLRPLLIFFTLPFVIVTFGLGVWIINATLLYLAARIVPGFEIDGFASALWGSLIISFVSLLVNWLLRPSRRGQKAVVMLGLHKNTLLDRRKDDETIDP